MNYFKHTSSSLCVETRSVYGSHLQAGREQGGKSTLRKQIIALALQAFQPLWFTQAGTSSACLLAGNSGTHPRCHDAQLLGSARPLREGSGGRQQPASERLHENKWSLSVRKQTLHCLIDHRHPAQPNGALDFIFLAEFKKTLLDSPGWHWMKTLR